MLCIVFTRVTLPPLWIADQVRNDVSSCPAGGFWMESRMMAALPHPVDSRLRGNDGDMFAKVTYMGRRD